MQMKSDSDKLYEIIFGYRLTQCLYVAVKLKVADFLSRGPLFISDLAFLAKVNESALHRVLKCLSAVTDICAYVDGSRY